jgi:hypothetical protein
MADLEDACFMWGLVIWVVIRGLLYPIKVLRFQCRFCMVFCTWISDNGILDCVWVLGVYDIPICN